jgi:hypothetical protein
MTIEPQPLQRGKGVCILVYGVPGSGKTRFIGTGSKTLIVRPPTDHTESIQDGADVEEIVVRDHGDLLEVFQGAQQGAYDDFDWFWLDGVSAFEDHGLDDVFQAAIDRKPARADFGPDQGEYGINRSRIMTKLRDLVALSVAGKFNFGVTANVMQWYDPVAEEDIWIPMFGSVKNPLSPKLSGYMNIVAYLQVVKREEEEPQRALMVEADGFYGKDQFDCFPELKSGRHGMVDPTIPKLVSAMKKARRGEKPKPSRKKPARRVKKRRG